jgi:hypothetical protein
MKEDQLKRRLTLLALPALVAALGLAACDDDDNGTSASSNGSSETASVSFTEPMDGATTGSTVTADVELAGFQLDPDAVGKATEDGHGHLHFSMDDGEYDYPKYSGANGQLAKQLGVEGQYSPAVEPTITYSDLPPGEHTLTAELANNDHSSTGVTATTTFTVE